jgi:hypothetical protein
MNSESQDFEYDEASDEAFEASDEADEGSDEAFEASDEADEGSDEAFEASDEADEASDEADEASDEAVAAGEGDEAVDEEVSYQARLRADQDRNRRASWARQIAADQRLEAQRAAATQRDITGRIRSIQAGGRARVYSVGRLQGAGVVTAVLPNRRRSQMRIIPTLAPISEVNRLRAAITINDRRQAVATTSNSRAIASLAATQAAAVKKLSEQQVKSDRELGKRIVEGHNRLDKRITKELGSTSGGLGKHGKRMMRLLRRQRQRSIWNSILLATSAPFFAAYGDRKNPFGPNNLKLTGSLLGWMLVDEVVDQFASTKSKGWSGGASLFSYAAPVGNGATAYFLLNNKQHERFVSDVVTLNETGEAVVDVAGTKIAKDYIATFKAQGHSVVATVVGAGDGVAVRADLKDGTLTLKAPAEAKGRKVAFIVDTQAAAGA